jgi:hypothetical protein
MGRCLNCGGEAKRVYCSKGCRDAYYRRLEEEGGIKPRVCEVCGEEFRPRYPSEVECRGCREWLKVVEEEEKRMKEVVRRCMRCGVKVKGGKYFCKGCREANRVLVGSLAPAAWETEGDVVI